jgi:hypothetical protein
MIDFCIASKTRLLVPIEDITNTGNQSTSDCDIYVVRQKSNDTECVARQLATL